MRGDTVRSRGSAADPRPLPDDLLAAYAAGTLAPSVDLLVATHIALCPAARKAVATFEAAGGELLQSIEPASVAEDGLERLLARLEEPESEAPPPPARALDPRVPRPLADLLPAGLDGLRWQMLLPGLARFPLPLDGGGGDAQLLRVRPGRSSPRHDHEGEELVLILDGAMRDERDLYRRGEVALAEPGVSHRPSAEPGAVCYCLAVTTAPIRLLGPLGRALDLLRRPKA